MNCTEIVECLACGSGDINLILDLNDQPLANNFLPAIDSTEESFPLKVNLCSNCKHLQLSHAVDPKIIYTDYPYVSGTSKTYVDYMEWYASFVTLYVKKIGKVLDIGCNDCSQLDQFKKVNWQTLGIDPAKNLWSDNRDHEVLCDFFNEELAKKITTKFDVITSQNAFAHIPDPLSYLKAAKSLLARDGYIFISTSQADMVLNGEFDTIYHEHISFYNINSMNELAKRAGLHLIDVIKTPIHGKSYIFILSKVNNNPYLIHNHLAMEKKLTDSTTYQHWADSVNITAKTLIDKVESYRKDGYSIIGYGAAAKGNTLLNFTKIQLDFIVDDNPLKQGTFAPGSRIPVVNSDSIKDLNDKVVFIPLAWNFFDEIKSKIKTIRDNEDDVFLKYFSGT